MDDDLRRELNRLHADIAILRMALSRIWSRHFDSSETAAWHERMIARFEADHSPEPEILALMCEALDKLTPHLAFAAREWESRSGS